MSHRRELKTETGLMTDLFLESLQKPFVAFINGEFSGSLLLLRRLKKDVEKDLPDKVYKVTKCKMSALQSKLDEQMRAVAS